MKRIAMGALALILSASAVFAGSAPIPPPPRGELPNITVTPDIERPRYVGRDTAIEGCVKRVRAFDEGQYVKWLDENADELGDVAHQLRKDKLPNWKDLLMGAAISICMPHKGYYNKCIADHGNVDGDLQVIETARISSCWVKGKRRAAVATPPPPVPVPTPIPPEHRPEPPQLPPPSVELPRMSAADMRQYQEDHGIVTQRVTIIGDEGGAKEARHASCRDFWQQLHHNRPSEVRQILYAVRVWRCMFHSVHDHAEPLPECISHSASRLGTGDIGNADPPLLRPFCRLNDH